MFLYRTCNVIASVTFASVTAIKPKAGGGRGCRSDSYIAHHRVQASDLNGVLSVPLVPCLKYVWSARDASIADLGLQKQADPILKLPLNTVVRSVVRANWFQRLVHPIRLAVGWALVD